ncbi:HD domain-containing protein [Desulfovibrio sp. Fe33]|uniref:HD domain-containing protein n=1 Tax=Desulfovibrio sp. Fe33 TaxID=3020842 RepID=UPI00234CF596|nr:HD domain-containing protein [Desulfovibrio sp. Fe33]
MSEAEPDLYDFTNPEDAESVLRETEDLMRELSPGQDWTVFRRAFDDVERLFSGRYPGYRASNTPYHDFEHTCAVVLAAARLIYGAAAGGEACADDDRLRGLLAALFHDVGLIQEASDTRGTGAKYLLGHEERSIRFMRNNLAKFLPAQDIADIADCIRSTILSMPPSEIPFRSEAMRRMGQFVGSADILAQIADRRYPEKLLLLFEEFREARLFDYDTAFDLALRTRSFYRDVARKRLDEALGGVDRFIINYFQMRLKVDKDLYWKAIDRNLAFLDKILAECVEDMDAFPAKLRLNRVRKPTC